MLQARLRDVDEFLGTFVDQPDAATLIVSCEDMATGFVHAAIEGFDERRSEDVGLVLSAPVEDIDGYVSGLTETLRATLREADASSAAAELPALHGRPEHLEFTETGDLSNEAASTDPIDEAAPDQGAGDMGPAGHTGHTAPTTHVGPPQPFERQPPQLACSDPEEAALFAVAEDLARSPAARVEALLLLLLRRLPEGDHRLLLALNPARITDHRGYQGLVRGLLALRLPKLRLVLRDERPPAHLPGDPLSLEQHPDHHLFDLPLDFDLLVGSVRAATEDPRRPLQERLASLLQLGFYDLGHGAPDEAELCFLRVLDEIGTDEGHDDEAHANVPQGASQLSSLALYGLGMLRARQERPNEAKELLLRAWSSSENAAPVTKAPLALSLGEALTAAGDPESASVFLALASSYASEAGAPHLAASALRALGEVELRLGHREDAREAWALGRQVLGDIDPTLAQDLERLLDASAHP